MKHYAVHILLTLIAAAMLAGCNTSGCLENQSAIPKAGFYAAYSGQTVAIDSIAVWGVGSPGDSLLVNGRASSMYLPLRSTASEAIFCIHYLLQDLSSPQLNDTLRISYNSTPKFVSEECGAMYYHTVLGVSCTTHLIDSVTVKDPDVTNFDKETLRIYFRIAKPEDPEEDDADNTTPEE